MLATLCRMQSSYVCILRRKVCRVRSPLQCAYLSCVKVLTVSGRQCVTACVSTASTWSGVEYCSVLPAPLLLDTFVSSVPDESELITWCVGSNGSEPLDDEREPLLVPDCTWAK